MKKTFVSIILILLFLLETLAAQNWSLSFDGNDYVLISSSSDFSIISELTIDAWIKVNVFDRDWQAIVTRGDDSWRIHRYNNTNQVAFSTNGLSNQDLASSTEINDGQWHRITAVYDGTTKYIYIDGELDASVGVTGTLSTNSKSFMIGENCDYYNRGFKGKIDEVRIWNVALCQDDIQDMTCGLPDDVGDSLVAYYQMSDGSGTSLTDDSSNGHTGNLNGPPAWDTEDYISSYPEGSQCNPYLISNLSDLQSLMNNEDVWDDGAYFRQTADIDASATSGWDSGQGFSPIGTLTDQAHPFIGHYDGQGYCIDQLYINRPSVSYVGLFGYIEGSTIENLGLTNLDITSHQATAALVGDAKSNSHIENCYSTGTLHNDESLMGGLIGSLNSSTVKHCYSSANLYNSSFNNHYNFGGLIASVNEGGLVENSYSTGNLNTPHCFDVGGFAGCLDGTSATIKNCYSTGDVNANPLYDGGFLGNYWDGSVLNCFWDTETSGLSTSEGGTGLTTDDMKNERTYTDVSWSSGLSEPVWDFYSNPYDDTATEDYWDLDPSGSRNTGYPYLSWEYNTHTLPVELSTFTAQFIENTPTIYWSTQSETDNMGWFVYRNDENDFSSSEVISDMIEGHGTTTQQQFYTYEDDIENPEVGDTYYYWLESVDYSGIINHYDRVAILTIPDTHGSNNNLVPAPERFGLFQNEPNPVINSTRIAFNLHETAKVDLAVYNLKGQLVKKLYSGVTSKHTVMWNGKDEQGNELESGVYLYRLLLNGKTEETKKLILMK